MYTLNTLLDKAKNITGSDYQTAKKLGVSRQYISLARKGCGLSNDTAAALADILKVSPIRVIAASELSKNRKTKHNWQQYVATVAILSIGLLVLSGDKSIDYAVLSNQHFIHYAHE